MSRYSRIKELFSEALQRKTGWGKNEVTELLNNILLQVADEEVEELKRALDDETQRRSYR